MKQVRQVSYSWDSSKDLAYRLDCYIALGDTPVVDEHQEFATKEELYEAMEEVIPLLLEASA